MNRSRSSELLARHGTVTVATDLAARVFSRATGFDPVHLMAWSFAEKPVADAPSEEGIAWLDAAALERHAEDAELDLPLDFVCDAMARGHRVAGIVEDGVLQSYEVFTSEPTTIPEGLIVTFPPPFVYAYKAFTRESARGRGLHGRVTRWAAHQLANEGATGMVVYVRAINHASLASFRRIGFEDVGLAFVDREHPGVAFQPPTWKKSGTMPMVRLVPADEALPDTVRWTDRSA